MKWNEDAGKPRKRWLWTVWYRCCVIQAARITSDRNPWWVGCYCGSQRRISQVCKTIFVYYYSCCVTVTSCCVTVTSCCVTVTSCSVTVTLCCVTVTLGVDCPHVYSLEPFLMRIKVGSGFFEIAVCRGGFVEFVGWVGWGMWVSELERKAMHHGCDTVTSLVFLWESGENEQWKTA